MSKFEFELICVKNISSHHKLSKTNNALVELNLDTRVSTDACAISSSSASGVKSMAPRLISMMMYAGGMMIPCPVLRYAQKPPALMTSSRDIEVNFPWTSPEVAPPSISPAK